MFLILQQSIPKKPSTSSDDGEDESDAAVGGIKRDSKEHIKMEIEYMMDVRDC